MGEVEDDRNSRKARKSALTRETNNLRQLMVEDEYDDVKERIQGFKDKFKAFEEAHDKYHAHLTEETPQEESEGYFEKVSNSYVETFSAIKFWLSERDKDEEIKSEKKQESEKELLQSEMMKLMNLPKLDMELFDENPLLYHSFFAIFDEHVHRSRLTLQSKLTYLLRSTCGDAAAAIRPYSAMGDEGYEEARSTLKKRFGNDLHIAHLVKNGKYVKTPRDLQELADELKTCRTTLKKMGRLQEIDTQGCIDDIAKRLESHRRNRWRRQAMEYKGKKNAYPGFMELVKFIELEAELEMDPVCGSLGHSDKPS